MPVETEYPIRRVWVVGLGFIGLPTAARLASRGVEVVGADINPAWPEEANRRLVARLDDLHFTPTPRARGNLVHEGIGEVAIVTTGNPGIDAL